MVCRNENHWGEDWSKEKRLLDEVGSVSVDVVGYVTIWFSFRLFASLLNVMVDSSKTLN